MSKKVYSDPNMMAQIEEIKRFIDDAAGFFYGTEQEFNEWLSEVNRRINPLGLHIDESNFRRNSSYTNFLDIQYCFDTDGALQTDLYTKETDSKAYLNFSSSHPNHTFSGNVYSQSLRLKRNINSDNRCFWASNLIRKLITRSLKNIFNVQYFGSPQSAIDWNSVWNTGTLFQSMAD